MRVVNGMVGAAVTLSILATGMYTVNIVMRSFAARRLADRPQDLNAEAILLGF